MQTWKPRAAKSRTIAVSSAGLKYKIPDPNGGMSSRTAAGQVIGPDERLTARAALALYTAGSSYAMHRETEIGSLEPGKLADFTVLDRNPLSVDPEQITGIRVLATVVDGTPTYQAAGITFPGPS